MPSTPIHGWQLLALESELSGNLCPIKYPGRALAAAKIANSWVVIGATCPHRGAHLGWGAIRGNCIVCAFHSLEVAVGTCDSGSLSAPEFESVNVGGAIFSRFSDSLDCGFFKTMASLRDSHDITFAFRMEVNAPSQIVIENGFDTAHFHPVHGIRTVMQWHGKNEFGAFEARGSLLLGPKSTISVPFVLTAFCPMLSLLRVEAEQPYGLLVAATPASTGCTLRVLICLPKERYGDARAQTFVEHLICETRAGIEHDKAIWDNMDHLVRPSYTVEDVIVREFDAFCRSFKLEENHA